MRIEKANASTEKRVLTGMIVDDVVCGRIATKWDHSLFKSKWANTISQWCKQHYDTYGVAPGRNIEGSFEAWALKHANDKDTVQLLEKFLGGLSDEYVALKRESNSQHTLDTATKLFSRNRLEKLVDLASGFLESNEIEEAERLVTSWGNVSLVQSSTIDVFRDDSAIDQAFAEKAAPLITYGGAAAHFFSDVFERDAFVAILAPEKRGKTWWLIDIAWRAATQRRKTAFFSVGDMSAPQMMRRILTRAAKRPYKAGKYRIPREIHITGSKKKGKGDTSAGVGVEMEYTEKEALLPLDPAEAKAAMKRHLHENIKSPKEYLRLSTHACATLSVRGIEAQLKDWAREGWVPDVIVIDYADILMHGNGKDKEQDNVNETWMQLRALSQTQHCCLVVATQANAAGGIEELLTRKHFSEDKRKLAHVTAMLGLNQNAMEKKQGIYRLNWIARRECDLGENDILYAAGNLAICNPCMRTAFVPAEAA